MLNGFGRSLESILPKLRHGYLVEDPGEAQRLACAPCACLLPDAGGRVLPQRNGDGRQAGQRRSAGAEARVARDRRPAGQAGDRPGAGGDGSGSADARDRRADRATGSAQRGAAAGGDRRRQPGRGAEADGSRGAAHRAAAAGVDGAGRAQQGRARSQAAVDRPEARRGGAA